MPLLRQNLALSAGLQAALWRLGGVPEEHYLTFRVIKPVELRSGQVGAVVQEWLVVLLSWWLVEPTIIGSRHIRSFWGNRGISAPLRGTQ